MINRKNLFKVYLSLIFFVFVGFLYIEGSYYLEYQKVAKAAGAMPWQDAGMITYYDPACSSSYDPITGLCKKCPMCTNSGTGVGRDACAGFQEIQFIGQLGTLNMCVPVGFVYSGGGVMPRVGSNLISGGVSNILPWVIGIPK